MLCEVFKCLKGLNPLSINELFEIKEVGYTFRSCTRLYQPKKLKTTHGLRSVSYVGAKLWNDFCPFLADEMDLNDFKIFAKNVHENSLDSNFENYV